MYKLDNKIASRLATFNKDILKLENTNNNYIEDIQKALNKNTLSKNTVNSKNINYVSLDTKNYKKQIFYTAIFNSIKMLPQNETSNEKLINQLTKNFSNSKGIYRIKDLKLACKYLLRDRLNNQGGQAFKKLIQDVYYIFDAIEKMINNSESLDKIKKSLKTNLAKNTNLRTLTPLVASTTTGLFSAGATAAVFFTSVFKSIKIIMLKLVASVSGHLGISSAFVVAGTITGALLAGALLGYGVYYVYRKYREDMAKQRLNIIYINMDNDMDKIHQEIEAEQTTQPMSEKNWNDINIDINIEFPS